jgi:hypothetical protein
MRVSTAPEVHRTPATRAQTRHADGHEVEPHRKDGTHVEEGDNGREEEDEGTPERGSRRSACRFSSVSAGNGGGDQPNSAVGPQQFGPES